VKGRDGTGIEPTLSSFQDLGDSRGAVAILIENDSMSGCEHDGPFTSEIGVNATSRIALLFFSREFNEFSAVHQRKKT
jgi:hypothetical protein